jgi:hypothetical protein
MARGEKATAGQFCDFRGAVLKADGDAEVRVVAQWQQHMPENWQACRDFLARRFPDRWGPQDKHDHRHSGNLGLAVAIEDMSDEDLDRAIAEGTRIRAAPAAGAPEANGRRQGPAA